MNKNSKKALLIGINYKGTSSALKGCINDVLNVEQYLLQNGYNKSEIRILRDDYRNPQTRPTAVNIVRSMNWLISGTNKGDSLFFHYSGHGAQVPDRSGDEIDGMDETIVPCDFQRMGLISDDMIFRTMIQPIKEGVKLNCIMDCCHSGTGLDLPYIFNSNCWKPEGRRKVNVSGDICMISGCRDNQTSADDQSKYKAGGALTNAFLSVLNKYPSPHFTQLIKEIYSELRRGRFSQIPMLSSSKQFDLNTLSFNVGL